MSAARRLARLALFLSPALAQGAPAFDVPIACDVGKRCIVQNYVDRDPGPGARDYRCGFLSYDGHKGTDIRVTERAFYQAGVAVLAAAPGRVRAVRDGMKDGERVAGKEAGNSVVVVHGEGWETQYAHMRRGSVAVRPGQSVQAGDKLGVVGLSGNTEFPHVHFEVRHERKPVDPFAGVEAASDCHTASQPLWTATALERLAYKETGVLNAGFSGAPPAMKNGDVDTDHPFIPSASSPGLVFWVHVYGAQAGDVEELKLLAPDGRALAERRGEVARNKAQWLSYVGRRRAGDWPAGVYRGEYLLYRGEARAKVLALAREVRIGVN